jgi:phosphatidylglycerophosphate synthase
MNSNAFSGNKQISGPPEGRTAKGHPLTVLNACRPGAWERVGGVPLVGRTLFHLNKIGIREIFVLLSGKAPPLDLSKWQGDLGLNYVQLVKDVPPTILTVMTDKGPVLYLNAAHLIDPRLIGALTTASETTLLCLDAQDIEKEKVRAGFFYKDDLHIWAESGISSLIRNSRQIFPDDIDSFSLEMRGTVNPYFIEINSRDDARKATRVIIRSMQKKVMDLPAEFIDPYLENALTMFLLNTPVTPNMVTMFGLIVAITVACLFWHGHFVAGALCAFIVEILDGVDGKLARTKLQFTKFGEYECIIDYLYENSWYVAIGMGLSHTTPDRLPALLACLLVVSDTVDNILYTLSDRWYGKSIDLFSPFDSAFRRIAGRRNIYGFMFIIGFSLGYPLKTFFATAVWAAITATVHAFRLIQFDKAVKET